MSGSLAIALGDLRVGDLWGDAHQSHFQLDRAYLDHPRRRVLGQWFEDRLSPKTRTVRGMQPWFENVLPERQGALRRRLTRLFGVADDDDFGLLAALGGDLPGSVLATPASGPPPPSGEVDEIDADRVKGFRASLGGMQLKFALSGEPDRLTVGVRDPLDARWILKVSGPAFPGLAENEHAVMRWCAAAGFDVPETHVLPRAAFPELGEIPGVETGFLVRRFDREADRRIHQEDFAQVLGFRPGAKYAGTDTLGLARAAGAILGRPGLLELLRRLVLVVATGNADAHLKNWSLLYPDGIRARWTPLYDQVATIAYDTIETRLALRIGHARHLRETRIEHIVWLAGRVGIPEGETRALVDGVLEDLRRAFDPERLTMAPALAERLAAHWTEVPLLEGHRLGEPPGV